MRRVLPGHGLVDATDPDGPNSVSGSVTRMTAGPVQYGRMTGIAGHVATTYRLIDSPLGRIRLIGHDDVLTGLHLADHERCPPPEPGSAADEQAFEPVRRQLDEYFAGNRKEFSVAIDLQGSPFQVEVWTALLTIPFGATASYRDIAHAVGRPAAVRAVGAANGRNPISIIVPCHRVIGADGGLTGYGWGVDRKAWLLAHERDRGTTLF
jgi:methylated-DNA-[protein]-cysteine S-methyltransferase